MPSDNPADNELTDTLKKAETQIALINKQLQDKKFFSDKEFNDEMFEWLKHAAKMQQLIQMNNEFFQQQMKEEEQKRELAKEIDAKKQEEIQLVMTEAELTEFNNSIEKMAKIVEELQVLLDFFNQEIETLTKNIAEMTEAHEEAHQQLHQTISELGIIEFIPIGTSQRIQLDLPYDKISDVLHAEIRRNLEEGKFDPSTLETECQNAMQKSDILDKIKKVISQKCPTMESDEIDKNASAVIHKLVTRALDQSQNNRQQIMEIQEKKQAAETHKNLFVVQVKIANSQAYLSNEHLKNGRSDNRSIAELARTVTQMKKIVNEVKKIEHLHLAPKEEQPRHTSPRP